MIYERIEQRSESGKTRVLRGLRNLGIEKEKFISPEGFNVAILYK